MAAGAVEPGQVRLRGVSRKFRILHERNLTLKESALRRRRTRYTDLWALKDVDLDIAPGEAIGIIGQNGSGKSTLLKMISGIIPPTDGTVEVGGRIASMLELGAGFHPEFSGRENVFLNAAIHGLTKRDVEERLAEIIQFSELEPFIDMPVRTYSSGMYMRLAFAIAVHVDADVLLLDEVLAVGDEAFQRKCYGRVFSYLRRGGTLLFVSHDAGAVERVCERAIVVDRGIVVADGPPMKALESYREQLVTEREENASLGDLSDGLNEVGQEWGTGQVRIVGLTLAGPSGPTRRFASGDRMRIVMETEASERTEGAVFAIGIHTFFGIDLYGTNTRFDGYQVPPLLPGERHRIAFDIDDLPLHEGRFTLSLAVHSSDMSEVFHMLDKFMEFSVFQRGTGVGFVRVNGTWSTSDAEADGASAARTMTRSR